MAYSSTPSRPILYVNQTRDAEKARGMLRAYDIDFEERPTTEPFVSRAVQRKESGAGWAQRKMPDEGSCRAVDDWSRVIRGRHRGGVLARGPSAADERRAQCLGLAGRQCLAQCDQRCAAHRRVRLH